MSSAIASSKWRQQRLLVLCYHGVSQHDEHEWSDLYISPQLLAERLAHLEQLKATVLPFEQAVENLYSGNLPPLAISLTFDDGVCDFSRKALPLLAAAKMHSTLYLTTYYARKDMPVFSPFVSYVLWKGRGRSVLLPGVKTTETIPDRVTDPQFERIHAGLQHYAAEMRMTTDDKNEFARQISISVGADFDDLCKRRILHLMNPEEVRALDPSLVSVQLHTHRHRTPRSYEELVDELDRNAAEIASMTGRHDAMTQFCYPDGIASRDLIEWLRAYNVTLATTCLPGYTTTSTPRLEIPRYVDTMDVSPDTFEAWVKGSAALTLIGR